MASLRRLVRRSSRLTALVRGVRDAIRPPRSVEPARAAGGAASGAQARPIDSVPELHRVTARPGAPGRRPRLNLLLPTLNPGRAFGGARTALDLFGALGASFERLRLVTFTIPNEAALAGQADFRSASTDDDPDDARLLVAVPPDLATVIPVERDDVFLATFWTTAHLARGLVRWQAATFGRPVRPVAYLVQDFEPAFYPWSAQWALARATYDGDVPMLGVVNTGLLAEHLGHEGVAFAETHVFEPRLAPTLRARLAEAPASRVRRLVVYGRPETARNAFPLCVEGVRAWLRTDPAAADWEIISVGRPHPPVDLGHGRRLTSRGMLDLVAYGGLLRESAIGLSLMISPHPSYPPLDMAHLGMRVVTNRFGTKDLATWHENIVSLEALHAETIGTALAAQAAAFEADPAAGERASPLRSDYLGNGPPFPFAAAVAARLVAGL